MVGQVWTSNSRTSRVTCGKSIRDNDFIQEGPGDLGSVAALKPFPAGTLSHENKQPLILETRARDLDRDVYQDPDSDRYLISGERVFDNAADDLQTIAVSKRSISLLP